MLEESTADGNLIVAGHGLGCWGVEGVERRVAGVRLRSIRLRLVFSIDNFSISLRVNLEHLSSLTCSSSRHMSSSTVHTIATSIGSLFSGM